MARDLWDETLLLGVEEVDRQHRELFTRFGRLLDACREGHGREELKKLLDFLAAYIDEHFRSEEGFMHLHDYAEFEAHCSEHERFRQKLSELQELYADQGAGMDLLAKTNTILLDWIIQHIRKTDRKLKGLGS